jgi:site-specific DNA-cytosine methylase
MKRRLRMLAACECSGRVRDAFSSRGWDAWSCDLEPSETPGQHIEGDILQVFQLLREKTPFEQGFDLIIAFPPCTDLSLAGAVWWKQKQADGRQQAAAGFFMEMVSAPAPYVAVENPRGIMSRLYQPPDQVVEPWWFGDPFAKKTCLWLKNLPELAADNPVEPTGRVTTGGGSWRTDKANGKTGMHKNWEDSQGRARRKILRSITPQGFARAASEQWGGYIERKRALWDGY